MAYNRYMKGMSNGGNIFWDGATPLENSELRHAVPSLFATEAHDSRSDRFVPIPTVHVLDGLRAADFMPVMAQQARTRVPGKQDYTRHMIRLRHKSLTNTAGEAFEVILVNANDGTAAYKMIAGIFRFVCANGLFTGEAFDTVSVRHAGKTVIEDVRAGALNMLNTAPRVLEHVERFKGITLDRAEALTFAEAAHRVRFANAYESDPENPDALPVLNESAVPVQPLDLLRARRSADKTPTLWSAFNIVQENTIRGGQRGIITGTSGKQRRAKVREVKGIAQTTALNQALWDLTEKMADLKCPA